MERNTYGEPFSQRIERAYQLALKRSFPEQMEEGGLTPAERFVLKIADLQRRCEHQPIKKENVLQRATFAIVASSFLYKKFRIDARSEGLNKAVRQKVSFELSIRGL